MVVIVFHHLLHLVLIQFLVQLPQLEEVEEEMVMVADHNLALLRLNLKVVNLVVQEEVELEEKKVQLDVETLHL